MFGVRIITKWSFLAVLYLRNFAYLAEPWHWIRQVREVVVLAVDLSDEAMPGLVLEYGYHTGSTDLDATVLEVRHLRRQADELATPRLCALVRTPWSLWACRSAMCLPCWASAPQCVSQLTSRVSRPGRPGERDGR
jgi:hypothetical protein